MIEREALPSLEQQIQNLIEQGDQHFTRAMTYAGLANSRAKDGDNNAFAYWNRLMHNSLDHSQELHRAAKKLEQQR